MPHRSFKLYKCKTICLDCRVNISIFMTCSYVFICDRHVSHCSYWQTCYRCALSSENRGRQGIPGYKIQTATDSSVCSFVQKKTSYNRSFRMTNKLKAWWTHPLYKALMFSWEKVMQNMLQDYSDTQFGM